MTDTGSSGAAVGYLWFLHAPSEQEIEAGGRLLSEWCIKKGLRLEEVHHEPGGEPGTRLHSLLNTHLDRKALVLCVGAQGPLARMDQTAGEWQNLRESGPEALAAATYCENEIESIRGRRLMAVMPRSKPVPTVWVLAFAAGAILSAGAGAAAAEFAGLDSRTGAALAPVIYILAGSWYALRRRRG